MLFTDAVFALQRFLFFMTKNLQSFYPLDNAESWLKADDVR